MSVEAMLQRLAQIKEQRRQLDQQEKELVDLLRTTIQQQTDRLKALGYDLVPQQPVGPVPQPAGPLTVPPPPGTAPLPVLAPGTD
jgi:hypothetical protein